MAQPRKRIPVLRRNSSTYRVRLSPEGQERLSPRVPLDGWVRRVEDGLIVVVEHTGQEAAYHPDFLEPV